MRQDGADDDGNVLQVWVLAQTSEEFPAIYARQHHVQHDSAGMDFCGELQRLFGIASTEDRIGSAGEMALEQHERIGVVVHHQNGQVCGHRQRELDRQVAGCVGVVLAASA